MTSDTYGDGSGVLKGVKKAFHKTYGTAKKVSEKSGETLGNITKADKAKLRKGTPKAAQAKKTSGSSSDTVFQEQLSTLGKRLLGRRFAKVAGMVSRFVPESTVNKATDTAFLQVARLAEQWSKVDLPNEVDLEHITDMSAAEREALAVTVANQNRALAAMGSGVTGLTGLLGTVVDLMWLLLLSLRLIYQTAHLHGETLTGVAGAKRAFDVLSQADLSMLTEKQAVLVSMGAASELVDEADLQVLQGLIGEDNNIAFFQETVSNIAQQFNINLNLGWLLKLLPIAAGVTSAVYSVYIMNEISAVVASEFDFSEKTETKKLTLIKNS